MCVDSLLWSSRCRLRCAVRFVGEAAPGEDDDEHGSHGEEAHGYPERRRAGDELTPKPTR